MREIKFRAWFKGNELLYKDYELESWDLPQMIYNVQNLYDGNGVSENYVLGGYGSFGSILEDEKYILMQYTGLKDKNGKEIYEGDIVIDYSDTDVKYYVRYDTFKARFVLQSDIPEGYYGFDVLKTIYSYELHKDLSEEEKLKLGTRLVDIEVIGNIYDTQV